MNIESEVKDILRCRGSLKATAKQICGFTNFERKDIIKAIEIGGETVSDVYGNLLNLNRKRKWNAFGAVKILK